MSDVLVDRALETYAIELRRHFHRHPELSEQEALTSARVCSELERMGLSWIKIPSHHVIARLDGRGGGKRLVLRSDMDALPMTEESALPFSSANEGVAHTCGHDAHTAILLAAAKYLCSHRDDFCGSIFFCFQGSEEIGGHGACEVIAYLNEIGGADHAMGLHVEPKLDVGQLAVIPGTRAAGSIGFNGRILGRGGHGSRPDLCVDPILPACEAVQKISALPATHNSALDSLVINVAQICAGSANNIIPEEAAFSGTIRYFTPDLPERLLPLMRQMVEGTAASYGAHAEITFEKIAGPLVNSAEGCALAQKIISETPFLSSAEIEPDMGSDDFCEFAAAYTGVYALLGTHSKMCGKYPLHHPKFLMDESALRCGIAFTIRYALDWLAPNPG